VQLELRSWARASADPSARHAAPLERTAAYWWSSVVAPSDSHLAGRGGGSFTSGDIARLATRPGVGTPAPSLCGRARPARSAHGRRSVGLTRRSHDGSVGHSFAHHQPVWQLRADGTPTELIWSSSSLSGRSWTRWPAWSHPTQPLEPSNRSRQGTHWRADVALRGDTMGKEWRSERVAPGGAQRRSPSVSHARHC